jgi:hypothetical protein
MLAGSLEARRWILAATAGFVGALACIPHHASPPRPQQFLCRLPAVELPARHVVIADLLSRGSHRPDCGTFEFDTTMVFTDIAADNATLRVLVPCAELPRPMYSPTAGDAPVLQPHARYRLELSGPIDDQAGKNDEAWRVQRIDVVQDR